MNEYVKGILEKWVPRILAGAGVAIPDDEEEMNWRIFFASSQDMQGFRADIFTGGPNEDKHPKVLDFKSLRDRWPDSRTMIQGLAALWEHEATRNELKRISNRYRPVPGALSLATGLLRGAAGNEATRIFADTLDDLTGYRIARKSAAMVRAYIENSYLLRQHDSSFRTYLRNVVPEVWLPAVDIVYAERRWVAALARDFYNVGPTLANYMICDWLLWLWRENQLEWFESFKEDRVFLRTVVEQQKLPLEAGPDFVGYCRSLQLDPKWVPVHLGFLSGRPLPPRLLNEAIWLEENAHATADAPPIQLSGPEPQVAVKDCEWPRRRWTLPAYRSPEFIDWVGGEEGLARFREGPAYRWAAAHGFIVDDRWTGRERSGGWSASGPLPPGDTPPELTEEDEAILDRVWASLRQQAPEPDSDRGLGAGTTATDLPGAASELMVDMIAAGGA